MSTGDAFAGRGWATGRISWWALVERGTDEIVHAGICDEEGFAAVLLDVEDSGEQCAGLGDEEAAGFKQQMQTKGLSRSNDLFRVGGDGGGRVEGGIAVLNAESPAGINVGEMDAVFPQLLD